MATSRKEIVSWVSTQVLPHEGDVRGWLRSRGIGAERINDLVQEAYCRLAALEDISHIVNGRAYLFKTVQNVLLEEIRRARIVRIDTVAEIELLRIVDDEPTPEQATAGCLELRRLRTLIEDLPDKCRRIFELRRVQGVPQREIARMLGVSENIVEAQSARALKLLMEAFAGTADQSAGTLRNSHARPRNRKRN